MITLFVQTKPRPQQRHRSNGRFQYDPSAKEKKAFIDQVKNIETLKKCSVENLAHPLLLLSFLSRASEIIGKKLLISFLKIINNISCEKLRMRNFN